jgi:hypothetical protein
MKWLKRITDYYKDKRLAEKCGLKVKDICIHEADGFIKNCAFEGVTTTEYRCKKCGEFYR